MEIFFSWFSPKIDWMCFMFYLKTMEFYVFSVYISMLNKKKFDNLPVLMKNQWIFGNDVTLMLIIVYGCVWRRKKRFFFCPMSMLKLGFLDIFYWFLKWIFQIFFSGFYAVDLYRLVYLYLNSKLNFLCQTIDTLTSFFKFNKFHKPFFANISAKFFFYQNKLLFYCSHQGSHSIWRRQDIFIVQYSSRLWWFLRFFHEKFKKKR